LSHPDINFMGQTDILPQAAGETIVVFTVEGRRFGLGISTVRRALRAVAVTPLPNAPEVVLGLVNVQGEILPVFSPRRRLGLQEREVCSTDRLLIAEAGRRTVCLLVDEVDDVAEWNGETAPAAKELLPGGVEGAAKLADGIIFIYDLAKFLSLEEEAALDAALR